MRYNGSRGLGMTAVQSAQPLKLGARSASHTYGVDTPPRTASTDSDIPSWATMAIPQQASGPPSAFGANKDIFRKSGRSSSQRMSTQRKGDMVSHHLLVETALLDSQNFEVLTMQEVDDLKKEKMQLESKLQSTRKRLALESKVRDAAQSLHRLYADDTPAPAAAGTQSKKRPSFQKTRLLPGSTTQKHAGQAGDELAESQKKVDDLLQILAGLESRRQYIESRLLRHTAAVLQLDHEEQTQYGSRADTPQNEVQDDYDQNLVDSTISGLLNGDNYQKRNSRNSNGATNGYRRPAKRASSVPKVEDGKLRSLQSRIDGLNRKMVTLIDMARKGRGEEAKVRDSLSRPKMGDDAVANLESQMDVVDKSIIRLEREWDMERQNRNTVSSHLAETSRQLHSLLPADTDLPAPAASTAEDLQSMLDYVDEAALLLQQQTGRGSEDVRQRAEQYEDTVAGLWEILTSSGAEKGPFSLPAFSAKVQQLFDKAANADAQTEILQRQIQQQRERIGKSDDDKGKQLLEAQTARNEMEQELLELRQRHVAAETEMQASRTEMDKVVEEMEQIRLATKSNETQKRDVLSQLSAQKSRNNELEKMKQDYEIKIQEMLQDMRSAAAESEQANKRKDSEVQDLTDQLTAVRSAHDRSTAKLHETDDMEAELVRLTTELAMAKAELDGAYGSRAQRAKESSTAEVEELRREVEQLKGGNGRAAMLERELREMAGDLQDMARESVTAEREREELESLVDGLRERCEKLETQLGDEKVRWLGVTSPTVAKSERGGREQTSAMVLRNEFKKIMRETKAENARMLRAEQEERKRLEGVIRGLKRGKDKDDVGLLRVKT